MSSRFKNRVKENATGAGAGSLLLTGATDSTFRTFSSQFPNGFDFKVLIHDGADMEVCFAQLSGGTTLVRGAVESSTNGGSPVNFPAGPKTVTHVLTASDIDELRSFIFEWRANGPFEVDAQVDGAIVCPVAFDLVSAILHREIAGSSGTTEIDLKKNGTTVFSVKPSVTAVQGNNAVSSNAAFSVTAVAAGDVLTVDCSQSEAGSPENWSFTIRGI